jgi:hypothetical protein
MSPVFRGNTAPPREAAGSTAQAGTAPMGVGASINAAALFHAGHFGHDVQCIVGLGSVSAVSAFPVLRVCQRSVQ